MPHSSDQYSNEALKKDVIAYVNKKFPDDKIKNVDMSIDHSTRSKVFKINYEDGTDFTVSYQIPKDKELV